MQLKIPNDEQLQAIYRDMHKVEDWELRGLWL